jgi:hypothetical protein
MVIRLTVTQGVTAVFLLPSPSPAGEGWSWGSWGCGGRAAWSCCCLTQSNSYQPAGRGDESDAAMMGLLLNLPCVEAPAARAPIAGACVKEPVCDGLPQHECLHADLPHHVEPAEHHVGDGEDILCSQPLCAPILKNYIKKFMKKLIKNMSG